MTDGPTDPEDGGNPEDGPILSPDELDIADDEHVRQLDEGRYVVSPDGTPSPVEEHQRDVEASDSETADAEPSPPRDDHRPRADQPAAPSPGSAPPGGAGDLDARAVHDWLERELGGRQSRYSFDVTAKFDENVSQREMASNDVVTIFESLLLWYAQQIDRDTPVEEILGILLMESNVPIRFPAGSIERLIRSADVGPDDSVADLVTAIEDQDGLKL
jgi:hypothetical protein